MADLLPRFSIDGGLLSDDRGADAEGVIFHVEWLGLIFELHFYGRGK